MGQPKFQHDPWEYVFLIGFAGLILGNEYIGFVDAIFIYPIEYILAWVGFADDIIVTAAILQAMFLLWVALGFYSNDNPIAAYFCSMYFTCLLIFQGFIYLYVFLTFGNILRVKGALLGFWPWIFMWSAMIECWDTTSSQPIAKSTDSKSRSVAHEPVKSGHPDTGNHRDPPPEDFETNEYGELEDRDE